MEPIRSEAGALQTHTAPVRVQGNTLSQHKVWWLVLVIICLVFSLVLPAKHARPELLWAEVLGRTCGLILGGLLLTAVVSLVSLVAKCRMNGAQFLACFTVAVFCFMAALAVLAVYRLPSKQRLGIAQGYVNPAPPERVDADPAFLPPGGKSWNWRESEKEWNWWNLSSEELLAAARAGDPNAQVAIGLRLEWGSPDDGVATDRDKAREWYRKAADLNDPKACYQLTRVLEYDSSDFEKMLLKAADLGYAEAQFELGSKLLLGIGHTTNEHAAAMWFTKAAAQGDSGAIFWLGNLYETGRGVGRDKSRAALCYCAVANQDEGYLVPGSSSPLVLGISRQARFYLDMLQNQGFGIPSSREQAVSLYRKAAEDGSAAAQYYLGQIYQYGYGCTNCVHSAYQKWNRKAAEGGHGEAQFLLGLELAGKAETKEEAWEWLMKAASQHVSKAYEVLSKITPQ